MNRPTRKQTNQRVRQRVIAKQNIQEQKQKSDLPYSFLIPVVFSNRSDLTTSRAWRRIRYRITTNITNLYNVL